MNTESIKEQWLKMLLGAREKGQPIDPPSSTIGPLSMEEAYDVQGKLVDDMIKKGERIIGWKVGATNRNVMEQLNIDEPLLGCMTNQSDYSLKEVKASDFFKLAVEGEIAIVMGKQLRGPGITNADVVRAASGVMGAVELVDCRIKDWQTTPPESIADNALHGGIILGPFLKPVSGFDLTHEGVVMRKNGQLLASACGVEALGNPLNVVTWLANKLSELDREIKAGDIISTGTLTSFYFVEPGDVMEVSYSSLGAIRFPIID